MDGGGQCLENHIQNPGAYKWENIISCKAVAGGAKDTVELAKATTTTSLGQAISDE
jgi:hypothetical protein